MDKTLILASQSPQRLRLLKDYGFSIEVRIPQHMNIKIIETDPGEKGNTAQGGSKPAVLESGVVIQVPLFLQIGDQIKVDTKEKRYIERVKK